MLIAAFLRADWKFACLSKSRRWNIVLLIRLLSKLSPYITFSSIAFNTVPYSALLSLNTIRGSSASFAASRTLSSRLFTILPTYRTIRPAAFLSASSLITAACLSLSSLAPKKPVTNILSSQSTSSLISSGSDGSRTDAYLIFLPNPFSPAASTASLKMSSCIQPLTVVFIFILLFSYLIIGFKRVFICFFCVFFYIII